LYFILKIVGIKGPNMGIGPWPISEAK